MEVESCSLKFCNGKDLVSLTGCRVSEDLHNSFVCLYIISWRKRLLIIFMKTFLYLKSDEFLKHRGENLRASKP